MMKHRSSIIFVIVAAVLALAPQAAEQFKEFGRGVGSRVEGAAWNVFLNLHAQQQGEAGQLTAETQTPTHIAADAGTCDKSRQAVAAATQRAAKGTRGLLRAGDAQSARGLLALNETKGLEFRFSTAPRLLAPMKETLGMKIPFYDAKTFAETDKKRASAKRPEAEEEVPVIYLEENGFDAEAARQMARVIERNIRRVAAKSAPRRARAEEPRGGMGDERFGPAVEKLQKARTYAPGPPQPESAGRAHIPFYDGQKEMSH